MHVYAPTTCSKNSIDENAIQGGGQGDYDEQEMSMAMGQDEADKYNRIPGVRLATSDAILQAALRDHQASRRNNLNTAERRKPKANGAANGNIASHQPSYDNLGNGGYDNVAFKSSRGNDDLQATEI